MPISSDLMLAILAMDAYNRGYNAGVGDKTVGLGLSGQIGNAVIKSDVLLPIGSEAASFFAISYSWNGQTVISYRGTDEKFYDALNGYGIARGSPYGDEARVALH
jgi:hypothetical protein